MIRFTLLFLLGTFVLNQMPTLPPLGGLSILFCIMILACCYYKLSYSIWVIAPFAGFLYTAFYATQLMSYELPKELESKPIVVIGHIISLPILETMSSQFIMKTNKINGEPVQTYLKLTWPRGKQSLPSLRVGDVWHLTVRLKRIHSNQSMGAFDYEAWSLQKGLRAQGTVMLKLPHEKLGNEWYRFPVNTIRQYIFDKVKNNLPNTDQSYWLLALILGERAGVPSHDWQILRSTGTNHLMAIAGLHIGIVAGLIHTMINFIWRRFPVLIRHIPTPLAAATGALIVAFLYSALAGFSVPTERAVLMLAIFIITILFKTKINPWSSWAFAMLLVILMNPLSMLTESFWLSFATLAWIIYGMKGRLSPQGIWWHWGRVQWVIAIGIIPLSLFLFHEATFTSFIANSIAIPWLSFLILPICLLGTLFLFILPPVGNALLYLSGKSLSYLWLVLVWFAKWPHAIWHHAIPNGFYLILMLIGFVLLLLPKGFPGRGFCVLWLLPIFYYAPAKPHRGEIWLHQLDVGQGLATIVQTKKHTLVFDAGPKSFNGGDAGERIVLPYLLAHQLTKIDRLVISHGDLDHIGGANALMSALPILSVKTSVPEKLLPHLTPSEREAYYCLRNQSWEWDNVKFTFLYPSKEDLKLGNDSSCVLKIENQKFSILLTGDIERYAEKKLLSTFKESLRASIMVAPHHGSKTSGLFDFIAAVQPQYVLYATGYLNRYHFPHPSVVATYQLYDVIQLNTATLGTIQFKIGKNIVMDHMRHAHQRYWMDNMLIL